MTEGEEVLYHNHRTHVSRQAAPDGSGNMVCKRAAGPGAVRRIEHERAALRRLAGIPGVPRPADRQPRQILVLHDDGGRSPTGARLPQPRLIEVARALADTVARMHRAGVVHRDITPANLLLTGAGPPVLIDYDLALIGAENHVGTAPPEEPVGTLGYLAPEQTGRIRLATDRRCDLYGLGATLYTLATGAPPFPGDDPLELIRDTLVRVPACPTGLNPQLPRRLGEIIMRLLEKDPDRRYQSAEGLAYDLARFDAGSAEPWQLGVRDFPAFLSAPARLVGRDPEVRLLVAALDRVQTGSGPGVLVTGPPGVGKTALIQTLRPVITARGGWFVTGKYDQFGSDTGSRAIAGALRRLTRLLLAEPEPDVAGHRQRLTAALGPNAAVAAAAVPEMAVLLGTVAEPGAIDPATAPGRAGAAVVAVLRAVAAYRPVVFVLDDLQWAGGSSLRVLDAVLDAGPIPGLLVVGTYRDQEVDEGHPLAPLVARWERDGTVGPPVRLTGLVGAGPAELVGAILRMAPASVAGLAHLITESSAGNPYETVELLNALRTDGLLVLAEDGWCWDADAVRGFVARQRVPQLLAARLDQQPEPTRRLLTTLACLGGDVRPALLATGAGMPEPDLVPHLAPAIADGLITTDQAGPGAGTVRFRHDLVQQAARESIDADERDRLRLDMARRLAGHEESRHAAAEQYLVVAGLLEAPHERRAAAALLHAAGRNAAELTNYGIAEEFLAAAGTLLAADGTQAAARDAVTVDRHLVLHCLGRLDETDEVYRELVDRCPDLITLATATCTQINSLAQRGMAQDAVDLGLDMLRRLGITVAADLAADVGRATEELYRWVAALSGSPGPATAETHDPRIVVAGRLINRLLPPAYILDPLLHSWLVLRSQQLWARHGVCPPLVGTLGAAACVTIDQRDDYRTGYLLARHVLAVGRDRGYQAETALARYMYVCLAAPWFEPLEDIVETAQQTRDELLAAGDVQVVCLLSMRLLAVLLDSADSLEACADELPAALAFAERTGNRHATRTLIGYQHLLNALRGRTSRPGTFADADFDEAAYLADVTANKPAAVTYHVNRGIAALLLGDVEALDTHSAAAMADSRAMRGFYLSALARLLRCLSLTGRLRATGGDAGLVAELTAARDWLARRAADAPGNFRHLLRLVDAEQAWAQGDLAAATRHFDAGLHEVAGRPWHRALLAERAGRFHLGQGLRHAGRSLLTEARDEYRRWGADAKVSRLEAEHTFLRATACAAADGAADAGTHRIDLMAILRASQALSSQTTLAGLQAQVGDLLSAMTGATDVHVVLRHQETAHWYVSAIAGTGPWHPDVAAPVADPEAAAPDADAADEDECLMPLSAVRYVLRTRKPLLVADATHDDRFARDPYLAGLEACALLVVPIPCRSSTRAVLVLENRSQCGVFTTDRLETVQLLAGQLAVSIDNALLYDSLETTVKLRTAALAATNQRLADSERRLRSHFEHAAVGQVLHGTDDRIEEANAAFVTMTGAAPRDLGGTKLTDRFDPADRAAHRRELGAVIAGRQPLISRELVLLRADGRRLDVHVTVSAVRGADGRPEHLVSIFQDISARKVAEVARDAATIELADRNSELEAANRLKADLIGMLGHEIGNPLAIILGYVDLALDDETAPAPLHDLIAKIRGNAQRLAVIVQEVLALVSIDAGRLTAAPRPVRVAEHIRAAVAGMPGTGASLACPPDLFAAVQPGHLDHILTNLISNAAKYGGGATAITAARTGQTVTIEVRDQGAGVPAEFRERLFDRFARADATAGTVTGTGLGLYIVRELAGANGGDVRYRPAVPHGSIFVVTLPTAAAEPDPTAACGSQRMSAASS